LFTDVVNNPRTISSRNRNISKDAHLSNNTSNHSNTSNRNIIRKRESNQTSRDPKGEVLDFDKFLGELFTKRERPKLKKSKYKIFIKGLFPVSSNHQNLLRKKPELLKKKKKSTSNLYDIDNFVIQSSSKGINEKREWMNIPVPKFCELDRNFYSGNNGQSGRFERSGDLVAELNCFEVKEHNSSPHGEPKEKLNLCIVVNNKYPEYSDPECDNKCHSSGGDEEILDDKFFLLLHEEFEKREREYKMNMNVIKKKKPNIKIVVVSQEKSITPITVLVENNVNAVNDENTNIGTKANIANIGTKEEDASVSHKFRINLQVE
jgi:hypothetical protein